MTLQLRTAAANLAAQNNELRRRLGETAEGHDPLSTFDLAAGDSSDGDAQGYEEDYFPQQPQIDQVTQCSPQISTPTIDLTEEDPKDSKDCEGITSEQLEMLNAHFARLDTK